MIFIFFRKGNIIVLGCFRLSLERSSNFLFYGNSFWYTDDYFFGIHFLILWKNFRSFSSIITSFNPNSIYSRNSNIFRVISWTILRYFWESYFWISWFWFYWLSRDLSKLFSVLNLNYVFLKTLQIVLFF